jgi:hypothetical protein
MRRIALIATAGVLVALLVLAQLLLPSIAAQRLRGRLARSGQVLEVEVDAFPAIELLWNQADRVVIRMASYRSTPGDLGGLLAQAGKVGSLDASAAEFDSGLLTMRDAALRKRGNGLIATALVTEADLRAAVPFLDGVTPVASGGGQLTLAGTATVLGVTATVDATLAAQDGALVLTPDVPFGGFATVTVFSNPKLAIDDVAAAPARGGFELTARARLT